MMSRSRGPPRQPPRAHPSHRTDPQRRPATGHPRASGPEPRDRHPPRQGNRSDPCVSRIAAAQRRVRPLPMPPRSTGRSRAIASRPTTDDDAATLAIGRSPGSPCRGRERGSPVAKPVEIGEHAGVEPAVGQPMCAIGRRQRASEPRRRSRGQTGAGHQVEPGQLARHAKPRQHLLGGLEFIDHRLPCPIALALCRGAIVVPTDRVSLSGDPMARDSKRRRPARGSIASAAGGTGRGVHRGPFRGGRDGSDHRRQGDMAGQGSRRPADVGDRSRQIVK